MGSTLSHPLSLLQKTSFHGGLWCCPYTMTSITVPSAIHYYLVHYWLALLLSIFMLGSLVQYLATGALPSVPQDLLQYFVNDLAVLKGDVHASSRLNATGTCAAVSRSVFSVKWAYVERALHDQKRMRCMICAA